MLQKGCFWKCLTKMFRVNTPNFYHVNKISYHIDRMISFLVLHCQSPVLIHANVLPESQKQPSRGVLRKRCSRNMQQIYRGTPMVKCDFNKVSCNFIKITLRRGCSPVYLLHIFRTNFYKITYEGLLLQKVIRYCEVLYTKRISST